MDQFNNSHPEKGSLFTLMIAFALAAGFILWGFFIYYTVGVKWPPAWNFGSVPDVPGISVHSTKFQRPDSTSKQKIVPQHVMNRPKPINQQKNEP